LIIAGIVILVLVVWTVLMYNNLISTKNNVDNAWSQIDVQLKRRHSLIPNLVETVKGYMGHERGTLEAVTKARTAATQAQTVADKSVAEGILSRALGNLIAVAENYPDLKANQNFLALQEELTSTENRIAFARQAYNDAVLFFNNKLQMFPSNLIAGMFNFAARRYLEIENPVERENVQVKF
jgi:LemA protein